MPADNAGTANIWPTLSNSGRDCTPDNARPFAPKNPTTAGKQANAWGDRPRSKPEELWPTLEPAGATKIAGNGTLGRTRRDDEQDQHKIDQLLAMGFSPFERVLHCLERAHGRVDTAMEMLLAGAD